MAIPVFLLVVRVCLWCKRFYFDSFLILCLKTTTASHIKKRKKKKKGKRPPYNHKIPTLYLKQLYPFLGKRENGRVNVSSHLPHRKPSWSSCGDELQQAGSWLKSVCVCGGGGGGGGSQSGGGQFQGLQHPVVGSRHLARSCDALDKPSKLSLSTRRSPATVIHMQISRDRGPIVQCHFSSLHIRIGFASFPGYSNNNLKQIWWHIYHISWPENQYPPKTKQNKTTTTTTNKQKTTTRNRHQNEASNFSDIDILCVCGSGVGG